MFNLKIAIFVAFFFFVIELIAEDEDEIGTLIIVGKFKLVTPAEKYDAILLVADDAALTPKATTDKPNQKEFIEEVHKLTGDAKVEYIAKNAGKLSNRAKTYDLGFPASRGVLASGGNRDIFKLFQDKNLRAELSTGDMLGDKRAREAREKLAALLKEVSPTDYGVVVHVQIINGIRYIWHTEIEMVRTKVQRQFGPTSGIQTKRILNVENAAAIGLGETTVVHKWMNNFFGKYPNQKEYTKAEVEKKMKELVTKIRSENEQLSNVLGSAFKGYILRDAAPNEGASSMIVPSNP